MVLMGQTVAYTAYCFALAVPAGINGMLRRSLYLNGEFNTLMILAAASGALILIGFLAFFYNIVMSVGLKGVIGIFAPAMIRTTELLPPE